MSVYVFVVPQRIAAAAAVTVAVTVVAMAVAMVVVVVTEAGVDVDVEVAVLDDVVVVARKTSDEQWELPQSADCYRCSNKAEYLAHDRSRAIEGKQDINWVGCIEASEGPGRWRGTSHGGRIVEP